MVNNMDDVAHLLRDILAIVLPPAMMGMSGSAVRYLRKHRSEPFSWGSFFSGMITAAFAGVLMHCLCMGLGLNAWITSATVAMAGYCGGQILDLGQGVLLKWVERRAK